MKLIFEWNENKARTNLKKHHVDFEEAKTVFSDPLLLTYPDDKHSEQEERSISIGYSKKHRLLLVVHTEQYIQNGTTIIRVISSRKATIQERTYYES